MGGTTACGDRKAAAPADTAGARVSAAAREALRDTGPGAASDAVAVPADLMPTRMKAVEGLQGPESALYDPQLDVWFVSNINGKPTDKDNNGYIALLSSDGTIDSLKFVAGGRKGVTLHAPKGLAVVGDTLWVTDIDVLRAFNKRTGAAIATVSLAGKAKFLNDVTVGPDGIYFTDSGTNRVYRLGPGRKVTVALESDSLASPNGITWDSAGGRFIIVPFEGQHILTWTPTDTLPTVLAAGAGGFDGVELLQSGDILVTNWADSSLSAVRNGRVIRLTRGLPSPADLGVDHGRGRVMIPLLLEQRVEIWTLPITRSSGARVPGETHGEWVHFKSGNDSVRAYVAYPQRKTKAPGVIVIHEIFGLTKWEPTVVDRLAQAGFVAVAPDLLSSRFGMTPPDADSARTLVGMLEPNRVTADLNAAVAYLNSLPAVDRGKIGTIGFCWGGGQSFRYATNNPDLRAAVVCYGPAPDTADMARIRAPILGVYGENDARITAALPEVSAAMKARGKTFVHDVYPGTGHGFLKPGRQGYDGPEPERAWARIQEFLRARLGS